MSNEQDQKASRIKENKRRHRIRHKEYVLELQREVASARYEGIQATIQMQLAAQRVVYENTRLRSLLREVGVSHETIGTWLSKNASSDNADKPCTPLRPSTDTVVQEQILAHRLETGKFSERPNNLDPATSSSSPPSETCTSGQDLHSQKSSSISLESNISKIDTSPKQSCASSCNENLVPSRTLKPAAAPCRLSAPATDNATAAISGLEQRLHGEDELGLHGHGGIECSMAYRTLMQYATSQDKMDRITAALDYGCTPDGAGGCKVKNNVVWKILDDEC